LRRIRRIRILFPASLNLFGKYRMNTLRAALLAVGLAAFVAAPAAQSNTPPATTQPGDAPGAKPKVAAKKAVKKKVVKKKKAKKKLIAKRITKKPAAAPKAPAPKTPPDNSGDLPPPPGNSGTPN
jgi:hypothetical protein